MLQHGQLEGLAGAVGDAGDRYLGPDEAFVDQLTGEVLGVTDLVALVGQVDPAFGTGRCPRPGRGRPAGVAETPGRVHEHGVALGGHGDVVDVPVIAGALPVGLGSAQTMEHDDQGEGSPTRRREGYVGIERDAVE